MKMNEIYDYLDELFPDARCELKYHKDYEFLIAVMLSAQTTDKRVNMVTEKLFQKYPTLESLSKANKKDIINIIYPLGTFQKKAQNILDISNGLLKDCGGVVPNDREYLESLSGVGRKTTNVVLAELYNVPCIAVDTHVSRVSKRLKLATIKDDVTVIEKKLTKKIPKEKQNRLHHQLVLFGRYYCKAQSPLCETCKISHLCRKNKKV